MTHAYDFGRLIKRGFYVSPDMMASGNLGTITPPKRKKKKKKPVDNNSEEQPNRQTETLSAKSAAYLFGAWMKQAQDPTQIPSGTLSLNNPGQIASPSITVSGGTQGPNMGPPTTGPDPTAPRSAWQEYWDPKYKSHTGLGTYVDTLDRWYNPWTTQTNYEKGEKGLMRAGQTAMGVAGTAAATAGAITAAPAVAGMFSGGSTAAGGTAAGGAAAASQTPAGQNLMQRGSQMAGNVVNGVQRAADVYQRNIAPTLDKLNYKPEDVLHDGAAAVTGNFDQIKGPNWSKGMLPSGLPQGAPSIPRPLAAWKTMYGNAPGMLPGTAATSPAKMMHAGM